ncbi:hypothetical protein Tco_0134431 [Tanacetum coccineum]
MSSLSTPTNPLTKPPKKWLPKDRKLANLDKRLRSIIISCLPNDVMKAIIKCATTQSMWNDFILAHEGFSDIRDTKIATLRLKFNAFKALKGKKRLHSEFLADLNAEFHERALLANQKRFYKRSRKGGSAKKTIDKSNETCSAYGTLGKIKKGLVAESFDWDEEFVSLRDKRTTKIKAFMAIAEEEPYVGKANTRSDYTHVDLHYVEDQRKNQALGGRSKRKEKISSKEVIFTKADESSYVPAPEITFDFESQCDTQEPLPPLPKLIGANLTSTSNNLISLADLTLNMTGLTLNTIVPKKTKQTSNKVSPAYVIKKETEIKPPSVLESCSDKKAGSSTEQLFLTLMDEVKGLKEQIKTPSGTSPSVSQSSCLKSTKQKTWFGPCQHLIMMYFVKISKKAPIRELKRRYLKITVLTSNTSYLSRKIQRICVCTSLKTTKETRSIRRIQERPIRHIQAMEIKYSGRYRTWVLQHKIGLIITNLDVIGVIEDEKTFGKLSDEDAVYLCLLLALEVIFMGRLLTFKVDDTLFRFEFLRHLKDVNGGGLKTKKYQEHLAGRRSRSLKDLIILTFLQRSTSDLRPTIVEYQSSWWIHNNVYFLEHILRAPPIRQQHTLFETYLSKLEKSRKRGNTSFMVLSVGSTNDNSVRKEWLSDLVIRTSI